MNLSFFLPMIPPTVTHQEKKIRCVKGKPIVYEPDELRNARAKLTAFLSTQSPNEPLKGALSLTVKWCFPFDSRHKTAEWKTTKPDTDNLNKLLKDVMTRCGYWNDDAQVCRELIEKFYNEQPGIFISVIEL